MSNPLEDCSMKEATKQKILSACKWTGIAVAGVAGVAAATTVCYAVGHTPAKVTNPCPRTFMRKDGIPKIAFSTAWRANLQAAYQFFRYGAICNPYEAFGKFYTGHGKTLDGTYPGWLMEKGVKCAQTTIKTTIETKIETQITKSFTKKKQKEES